MSKLTPKFVKEVTEPGSYQDGRGLTLRVSASGRKSWVFRYSFNGVRHDLALGSFPGNSLRDARLLADAERVKISRGGNPLEQRQAAKGVAATKRKEATQFRAVAQQYIKTHTSAWSKAYADDWAASMKNHVYPRLGKVQVGDVDTEHVLAVLRPVWATIPTTAQRIRNRIELVLDAARAMQLRKGENPARWRGHLDKLLPRQKVSVKPFKALPWEEAPSLYERIASLDGIAARALELVMLTACRSSEVRNAEWSEFDMTAGVWTIPASRMKNRKIHRVPLTPAMVEVLNSVKGIHPRWVFKKSVGSGPLPANALSRVLERLEISDAVPHGFRSTFRTWAAEATDYQRDVCEMALAHTLPSKVEAAYNRADLLEKRRGLMQAWSCWLVPGQEQLAA